jgi:hypothetical protein
MTTRTTSKGSGAPKKKAAVSTTAKKAAPKGKAVPAPRKPRNLAERMPGEQHPGQTTPESKLHDRAGSQPERERHQHPGSTTPKRGAGRTDKRATKR